MAKPWAVTVVLLLALAAALSTASPQSASAAPSCGVERWSVRTLQDPAGRALNLSTRKTTTVSKLRSMAVRRGPGGSRGAGAESTVFQVRARLVEAKVEDDSDIHLVIRDLKTSGR